MTERKKNTGDPRQFGPALHITPHKPVDDGQMVRIKAVTQAERHRDPAKRGLVPETSSIPAHLVHFMRD